MASGGIVKHKGVGSRGARKATKGIFRSWRNGGPQALCFSCSPVYLAVACHNRRLRDGVSLISARTPCNLKMQCHSFQYKESPKRGNNIFERMLQCCNCLNQASFLFKNFRETKRLQVFLMYNLSETIRKKTTSCSNMEFYVDYSCEDNSETGRTKLAVSDFDDTSIRDVKYAIQDAIQAPVCDQQLFYQGQPVTDDNMPLSRLYFREGDCFKLQFLAVADTEGMSVRLDALKNSAQKIVEKLNRQLPVTTIKEHVELCSAIQELTDNFFSPWKCLKSVAQRHFFIQEGGFEAFFEVFKFSRQLYHDFDV